MTSGWSELVKIMNAQKIVSTRMNGPNGKIIQIRKCSEPKNQVTQICKALNYKPKPFKQKKFVVPPQPLNDITSQQLPVISSA
jgi:hypothetical protein